MAYEQDFQEQFNLVANEYDGNRRRFIPCFDSFYGDTTRFLASFITEPERIIDLGAGTGLLSSYWHEQFKEAQYVLVDAAEDMLAVARRRFEGLPNFSYDVADYTTSLPDGSFDMVVSALSIHHLEDTDKLQLFHNIRDRMTPGDVFVNYDQFRASSPSIETAYDKYWIDGLTASGMSAHDLTQGLERRKLDRECSVFHEIELLKQAGFSTVECVFSQQKFSVIYSQV